MKEVLILSDVTLENVVKTIKSADYHFTISYKDDIVFELQKLIAGEPKFEYLYIHLDNYFKYYDKGYIERIALLIKEVSKKANYVLVSNLLFLNRTYSHFIEYENCVFQSNYNDLLRNIQSNKNVVFLDHIGGILKCGLSEVYNFNLGFLYQMPYKKRFLDFFKDNLIGQLNFLNGEEKKVIIVDCDNTLWHGIIGEDGLDGICCDNSAKGIIHFQFQKFLKSKKEDGFLLCLCSKNNRSDVENCFTQKRFPLKWDDFILKKINWENKIDNISDIVTQLGLSPSSFIFIDDSDFEINSIREFLPSIETFRFAGDIESLQQIMDSFFLKRKLITAADFTKTGQYEAEQRRAEIQKSTGSFEDYIRKLDIRVAVKKNAEIKDLARLSQMTGKTNQFNFNKVPYTVRELEDIMRNEGTIYSCEVSDVMGDYGIVGMAILLPEDLGSNKLILHNLLLSCRALGRGVEDTFWSTINDDVRNGNYIISGIEFVKTDRNEVAASFHAKINTYGNS